MPIFPAFQTCCPIAPPPVPTAPIPPTSLGSRSIDSMDLEPPPPGQPHQSNRNTDAHIISEDDLEPPPPGQPRRYNLGVSTSIISIEGFEDDYPVFSSDDEDVTTGNNITRVLGYKDDYNNTHCGKARHNKKVEKKEIGDDELEPDTKFHSVTAQRQQSDAATSLTSLGIASAHMLTAVAELTDEEQNTLKEISLEEVVESLRRMIQKKLMKRRNIEPTSSPLHKRTRH